MGALGRFNIFEAPGKKSPWLEILSRSSNFCATLFDGRFFWHFFFPVQINASAYFGSDWHPLFSFLWWSRFFFVINYCSGGENISSIEVETVLHQHEGVLHVAVIAMEDEHWGEVPIAVVEAKQGIQVGVCVGTLSTPSIFLYSIFSDCKTKHRLQ